MAYKENWLEADANVPTVVIERGEIDKPYIDSKIPLYRIDAQQLNRDSFVKNMGLPNFEDAVIKYAIDYLVKGNKIDRRWTYDIYKSIQNLNASQLKAFKETVAPKTELENVITTIVGDIPPVTPPVTPPATPPATPLKNNKTKSVGVIVAVSVSLLAVIITSILIISKKK